MGIRADLGKKLDRELVKHRGLGKKIATAGAAALGKKVKQAYDESAFAQHWIQPVAAAALEGAGLTYGLGQAESMHTEQHPKKKPNYRLQLKKDGARKRNNPKAYFPVGHSRPDGGKTARPNH